MWLNKTLALATTIESDLIAVKTLTNLGWCHYTLGDYERALTFLARADALAATRAYSGERQLALQMMGNAYYRLHDLEKAAEHYDRSLTFARQLADRKRTGELLGNLGIVALDQGRYDAADRSVQESLRIKTEMGDLPARQHALVAQGQIHAARRDYVAAEALYRAVLASPHASAELQWETRAALASAHVDTHQLTAAENEFRRALATMEESRSELRAAEHKISFFSSLDKFHDKYVDFLIGRGKTHEALEVADKSRARILREILASHGDRPQFTVKRFQEVARSLDAAILFYWVAPARSFLWVVTAREVRLHVLPGEQAIREHVDAHQALVLHSRDPLAEDSATAAWLYRALVQPAQAALPPGSRVIFIPDGPLHRLNPETLVVASATPHYWLEDVTLVMAPSLSLLATPREVPASARASSSSILIVGDPQPADDEFPRLAHASHEVRRIADQFSPAERTIYAGAQANPSAYLTAAPGRFSLVHFAAHASANADAPLESAVILSVADDSHKLYARQILATPLRADLVTISACRSAGSRTYSGEGLVGLTWAFLAAGAGSVVSGLWNVEDASTSDLMTDLYRRIRQGQRPAEALRDAKLDLVRSATAYRKPFYWAPFVTYTRGA
jgi:CHAT domain-containing protein